MQTTEELQYDLEQMQSPRNSLRWRRDGDPSVSVKNVHDEAFISGRAEVGHSNLIPAS